MRAQGCPYLPVLVQLKQSLVLSGTQHQEINEQEHAEWVGVWVQTILRVTNKIMSKSLLNQMSAFNKPGWDIKHARNFWDTADIHHNLNASTSVGNK